MDKLEKEQLELDQKISEMLITDLSDIKVSEELIQKTLKAAENKKSVSNRWNMFTGKGFRTAMTAMAAVLVLGVGIWGIVAVKNSTTSKTENSIHMEDSMAAESADTTEKPVVSGDRDFTQNSSGASEDVMSFAPNASAEITEFSKEEGIAYEEADMSAPVENEAENVADNATGNTVENIVDNVAENTTDNTVENIVGNSAVEIDSSLQQTENDNLSVDLSQEEGADSTKVDSTDVTSESVFLIKYEELCEDNPSDITLEDGAYWEYAEQNTVGDVICFRVYEDNRVFVWNRETPSAGYVFEDADFAEMIKLMVQENNQ